jgi:hypothetical protein
MKRALILLSLITAGLPGLARAAEAGEELPEGDLDTAEPSPRVTRADQLTGSGDALFISGGVLGGLGVISVVCGAFAWIFEGLDNFTSRDWLHSEPDYSASRALLIGGGVALAIGVTMGLMGIVLNEEAVGARLQSRSAAIAVAPLPGGATASIGFAF